MAYLLDTDVLIQAKNFHYGMDFCPAFWDWIDEQHRTGMVFSVEEVRRELIAGHDELAVWATDRPAGFFRTPGADVISNMRDISRWAVTSHYLPAAVSTFMAAADYYLIAHALAGADTVVTHELAAGSLKKIKIPDACSALGVKFVNPFTMLRDQGARFMLS